MLRRATPASREQRAIWRMSRTPGGSHQHTVPIRILLAGKLDRDALELALRDLLRRHQTLRTTFRERLGVLLQQVQRAGVHPSLTVSQNAGAAEKIAAAEREVFDLERDIPFRTHLIVMRPKLHLLVLSTHQIAVDPWSIRPLLEDFAAAYSARVTGSVPDWPELPLTYQSYSLSQRGACHPDRDLSEARPAEPLPLAQGPPSGNRKFVLVRVNPLLHKRVLALSSGPVSDLYAILHAALAGVLTKLGAQPDPPIGAFDSGRDTAGLERMVGPFGHTLVLRAQTVDRVRNPVEPAIAEGRLYRVLLSLRRDRDIEIRMHGLRSKVRLLHSLADDSDITLDLMERRDGAAPGGIEGRLEYDSGVFTQTAIETILAHWFRALESAADAPEQRIDDMRIDPGQQPRRPKWQQVYVPPSSPLQDQLCFLWEGLLGVERIGVWDEFSDAGKDPALFERMRDLVENVCGRRPPIPNLSSELSIEKLSAVMARDVPRVPYVELRAGDRSAQPPFFYLHGDWAGGGYYTLALSRYLDANQPFYTLPPHGLNGASPPTSIEQMAEDQIRILRSIQPRGPYCLGGHCNGGLIAFEIARRLQLEGESVPVLILIHARYGLAPGSEATRQSEPASAVPAGMLKLWTSVQYYQAISSYRPGMFAGNLVLLWPSEEMADGVVSPDIPWRKVATEVELRVIPGNHLSCLTRHPMTLAAEIQACLANLHAFTGS